MVSMVEYLSFFHWRNQRPSFFLLKVHLIVPSFNVRIIPVLGTISAIFGQVMASYVVRKLADLHVRMEPVVNLDSDHYHILHHRLIEHEELLYGTAMEVQAEEHEASTLGEIEEKDPAFFTMVSDVLKRAAAVFGLKE